MSLFLLLLTSSMVTILTFHSSEAGYVCMKPYLEITVAPVSKKLQLLWRIEHSESGSWVGLYNKQPNMQNPGVGKVDSVGGIGPSGWHTTNIVSNINPAIDFTQKQSLGYWAVYWRKNNGRDEAVTTTRLETYPDWMDHFWGHIGNRQLSRIFIPGTHDSVCHEGVKVQPIKFRKSPSLAKTFSSIGKQSLQLVQSIPIARDLTITQDQDIKQQLAMGIRYLDIRVLRNAETNEYWTAHSEYLMIRLDDVINDVIEFVSKTKREIVIFDIHQFISGLSNVEDQDAFTNHLKEKMGKWYVPRNNRESRRVWQMTLSEIVGTGGRIIVSYNNKEYLNGHHNNILWYPVRQYWADARDVNQLKTYFDKTLKDKPEFGVTCTAAMAELTPDGNSVKNDILNGVKHLNLKVGLNDQAEKNAGDIHSWFMNPIFGQNTNILAVDYFRAMGVVRLAFLWNERMTQPDLEKRKCDPRDKIDLYYQHNIIF